MVWQPTNLERLICIFGIAKLVVVYSFESLLDNNCIGFHLDLIYGKNMRIQPGRIEL